MYLKNQGTKTKELVEQLLKGQSRFRLFFRVDHSTDLFQIVDISYDIIDTIFNWRTYVKSIQTPQEL